MARYDVTGDFCVGDVNSAAVDAIVGSITMFDNLDGTPPMARGESVFSVLSFHAVATELRTAPAACTVTVIDAAEAILVGKVRGLIAKATAGRVTVRLRLAAVEDSVGEIAALRPWTMSWSNVLDYFSPSEFHAIARACSRHGDTIHFGYSMNWPCEVRGTSILDYTPLPEMKLSAAEAEKWATQRSEFINMANQGMHRMYEGLGWGEYLRCPPPSNPINCTGFFLESALYEKWVGHWFNFAQKLGPVEVGNLEHAMPSQLSATGGSTVYFTWTYDPKITFLNAQNRS